MSCWPAPATASGVIATALAWAGEPSGGLAIGLAGAAASIMLARVELRRTRVEIEDLRLELAEAMTHDGFLDVETGLGTLATLRLDWARQLARYQRRGERFSVAVFDVRETGKQADVGGDVLRAAAGVLRSIARTEDSVYRIGRSRLAVLLAGSNVEGATAFISRATALLATVEVEGRDEPASLDVASDIVDCREGVAPFPEHRLLWDVEDGDMAARMLRRWSGQRRSKHDDDEALPAA
jgi:GGDEF domain-containing protein